jgi:hypothetical protein
MQITKNDGNVQNSKPEQQESETNLSPRDGVPLETVSSSPRQGADQCTLLHSFPIEESIEEKALETLQKQKAGLSSEGKQLIEQLIDLHELTVFLGLCPEDKKLSQLLTAVKDLFLSSFDALTPYRSSGLHGRSNDGHHLSHYGDGDQCHQLTHKS